VDTALAFAAELEERDAALAGLLALLLGLDRRVDESLEAAGRISDFLGRLPRERGQLEATLAEAERAHESAQTELAEARRAVERAKGDEAQAAARRREANAASDAHTTAERRAQLIARQPELALEEAAAEEQTRSLELRANELAAELDAAPRVASPERPAAGLDGLVDWGSRAQTAVFVARSGVETERERVVREANELAASVLGEPLYAASVAIVRERLEQRLS